MEDLESIEKYLKGELDEFEKLAFEDKLQQDTNLQKELKLHKAMMQGVREFFGEKLLEDFAAWDKEVPSKQSQAKQIFLRPLLAVAAVILLLVVMYVGLNYSKSIDNQALFANYYQTYPNYASNTVRGENENIKVSQKAFQLYSERKYKEAIKIFEQLKAENNEAYYEINFYWALCYLELDEIEQAENKLAVHVLKSNPHDYTNPARWYLALTYLKMNQIEQCKTQLSYLISNNTDYTQKAKKLLLQLP